MFKSSKVSSNFNRHPVIFWAFPFLLFSLSNGKLQRFYLKLFRYSTPVFPVCVCTKYTLSESLLLKLALQTFNLPTWVNSAACLFSYSRHKASKTCHKKADNSLKLSQAVKIRQQISVIFQASHMEIMHHLIIDSLIKWSMAPTIILTIETLINSQWREATKWIIFLFTDSNCLMTRNVYSFIGYCNTIITLISLPTYIVFT